MNVSRLSYKPGWTFKIAGPLNRCLCVYIDEPDSRNPARRWRRQHQFEMPPFADDRDFARWVFHRLLDCERHAAGEHFTFDGFKPFYPNHQDEGDPCAHVERWET